MKQTLFIIGGLLIIGYVGHIEKQDQLIEQASIVCHAQSDTTTPSFEQCINNQLEKNGDK